MRIASTSATANPATPAAAATASFSGTGFHALLAILRAQRPPANTSAVVTSADVHAPVKESTDQQSNAAPDQKQVQKDVLSTPKPTAQTQDTTSSSPSPSASLVVKGLPGQLTAPQTSPADNAVAAAPADNQSVPVNQTQPAPTTNIPLPAQALTVTTQAATVAQTTNEAVGKSSVQVSKPAGQSTTARSTAGQEKQQPAAISDDPSIQISAALTDPPQIAPVPVSLPLEQPALQTAVSSKAQNTSPLSGRSTEQLNTTESDVPASLAPAAASNPAPIPAAQTQAVQSAPQQIMTPAAAKDGAGHIPPQAAQGSVQQKSDTKPAAREDDSSQPTAPIGEAAPAQDSYTYAAQTAVTVPAELQLPANPIADASYSATLSGSESGMQHISSTTKRDTSDITISKAGNDADVTATAKDKNSQALSPASDTSHTAQNNNQPTQHSPADSSQIDAGTTKSADATAIQPTAPTHTITHEAPVAHATPAAADDASRLSAQRAEAAASQVDRAAAAPAQGVNTARVLQTMSESEMRVGMRSTEFGEISIRTTVSQQQIVAQISVDHSDLGQAISAHVSTVQTRLANEYGLHASIEVNQSGSSFSNDAGQSSAREQQAYSRSAQIQNVTAPAEFEPTFAPAALAAAGNGHRLDIQA